MLSKFIPLLFLSAAALIVSVGAVGNAFHDIKAPTNFPVDNPFDMTEVEAIAWGVTLIAVPDQVWDKLAPADYDYTNPNASDWCMDNDGANCGFTAWIWTKWARQKLRAFLYNENCELIARADGFPFAGFPKHHESMTSPLKYTVEFDVWQDQAPELYYADQSHDTWDSGWVLYYPTEKYLSLWMFWRHFDCHRP